MKLLRPCSERILQFLESRENVDRLIGRIGNTVVVVGVMSIIVLVIAVLRKWQAF